jgi:hypothetical protein
LKVRSGHERFIRRLEAEFTADDKNYRGISSDLSISGLFIRTNHAFAPGTLVDIVIHLPDSTDAKLKGKVRRSFKSIVSLKNGMGIEIIENDPRYINFVKTVFPGGLEGPGTEGGQPDIPVQKSTDEPPPPEFTIITCPRCRVKNKVITAKLPLGPNCGKCGSSLTARA